MTDQEKKDLQDYLDKLKSIKIKSLQTQIIIQQLEERLKSEK